jgi:hypothetical protein
MKAMGCVFCWLSFLGIKNEILSRISGTWQRHSAALHPITRGSYLKRYAPIVTKCHGWLYRSLIAVGRRVRGGVFYLPMVITTWTVAGSGDGRVYAAQGGGGKASLIRARIFKLLRSPIIDSKERIPPGCVAKRASTTTLFLFGLGSDHSNKHRRYASFSL